MLMKSVKAGAAVLAVATPLVVSTVGAPVAGARQSSPTTGFNQPGDVLIADQFNNRVIEVDQSGNIVFQFGNGPHDFSSKSIVGVNDAERVGSLTLLAGTGDPPGSPAPTGDLCPDAKNGCPDNRVILVDPSGHIQWQYGKFGRGGSGPDQLNTPVQATFLPNSDVLITDQANERVIEVSMDKRIVWQYGTTGVSGIGADQLNNPNSAELLANGNILISDENNNRAIEVSRDKQIVATYTIAGSASGVAFSSRLPNGDTLITDSNNGRVVEVSPADTIVWQYSTVDPAGNSNPLPTRAVRLSNGDTLISDQFNDRVIDVTPAGAIRRQIGTLNTVGIGNELLDAPYDAKVIGDYTGLTPPSGF